MSQLTVPEMQKRRNKVKKLYLDGLSAREIANILGTAQWIVLNDLKALGVPRRPQGNSIQPSSARNILVAEAYLKGNKTQQEVGEEFGITLFSVNRHVRRYLRNNPEKGRKA